MSLSFAEIQLRVLRVLSFAVVLLLLLLLHRVLSRHAAASHPWSPKMAGGGTDGVTSDKVVLLPMSWFVLQPDNGECFC